jgi:DNA-binding SARP family transcriptional activator/predicted ATPase
MVPTLQIHLLGAFEVALDGVPFTNQDWRSQQTRAIARLLLARRGQVVLSDQILEIFWPDESPEPARKRLHVRISQIRAALGDKKTLLQTVDGGYLFKTDPTCQVDADQFLAAVEQGRREQDAGRQQEAIAAYEGARALYRGDFLAEDLYTDWTLADREYYRERFLAVLMELSECYAQQGRYRLAIARCQQALGRDALRESIYVRLMLYHYYAGERDQALRTFERCRQVLADDLGVEPLPVTLFLADQVQAGTLWASTEAPHYPPPIYEGRLFEVPYVLSETPFVGREREYAWLVEAWRDPEKRLLLVEGEAGGGKTRLLAEFSGYLATQGWQVLSARVSPGEHSPLEPLVTALSPLLTQDTLARLAPTVQATLAPLFPKIKAGLPEFPKLAALPPEAIRQRLYQALQALVAAGASEHAILLVDDAHRLGQAACEVLARLLPTLKVFLSHRGEETPANHPLRTTLQPAVKRGQQAVLRLDPLPPQAVRALIHQLAASDLSKIEEDVYQQTQGNPLYIVALLQHLFEEGRIYVDPGGAWGLAGDQTLTLPPSVRALIEARLQRLSPPQQRIFDLAAVLGGEFDFPLLQEASQQPEETLLHTLDTLIDAGLIFEPRSRGRAEFAISHDRYLETAYDTLPAVRRQLLHRQAAVALESLYGESLSAYYPALADHYGNAGNCEKELSYAILAGEQAAAQFAHNQALHYLGRALDLTPPEQHQQRFQLLRTRERVYDLLGDRTQQQEDLAALAALALDLDTCQQAEISHRQAAYAWIIGDNPGAEAALEDTIRLANLCQATDLEAAAYLLKGRSALDQAVAHRHLERALTLAGQENLRWMEGDILRALGNACIWQGNYIESEAYYQEALEICRSIGDRRGELAVLNNLGRLMRLTGRPGESASLYEEALEICRSIGDRLAEGVLLTNLGELTLLAGQFQRAQDWLEQARDIRREIENEEGVGLVLIHLGEVFRQQGQFDRALEQFKEALAINTRIQHDEQTRQSLEGLGILSLIWGDYEESQSFFERAYVLPPTSGEPNRARTLASWSLLQHLQGDHLVSVETACLALAGSQELPYVRASALTHMGHALAALNRTEEAQEQFRLALEIRRELHQPHLAAEPLAGLAGLALTQKDPQAALALVEEIVPLLEPALLAGPVLLFRVYEICIRVYQSLHDDRGDQILESAYRLLQERAASIADPAARNTYLQEVKTHREIVRLYQAMKSP